MHEEDDVRKTFMMTTAALMFLVGCGNQSNQASSTPPTPKWKGAPYHLEFGAPPAKPNPSGLTIPPIKYTANPDMLETRADLVVQFDTSSVKRDTPVPDQMIMGAVDISGTDGALPADYVDTASKELAKMLGSYCISGPVKMSVALTKSSLSITANDDQVNAKRMSDWMPITLVFKNPHPTKC
jgi:hypothetical protein